MEFEDIELFSVIYAAAHAEVNKLFPWEIRLPRTPARMSPVPPTVM